MRFTSKHTGKSFNFILFDDPERFKKFVNAYGIEVGFVYTAIKADLVEATFYIGTGYPDTIQRGEWLGFTDDLSTYDVLPNLNFIERYYNHQTNYVYPQEIINRIALPEGE